MTGNATFAQRAAARPGGAWQGLRMLVLGRGIGPALPAIIYLIVFLVLPLGSLFSFAFLSVERGVVQPGTFSLEHFAEALSDSLFWKVAWRSSGSAWYRPCSASCSPIRWPISTPDGAISPGACFWSRWWRRS